MEVDVVDVVSVDIPLTLFVGALPDVVVAVVVADVVDVQLTGSLFFFGYLSHFSICLSSLPLSALP